MEFLLVGHYCHDTIIAKDGGVHLALGGASAHASSVLGALGIDFRVVAKVGDDFRYGASAPRPPLVVPGSPTTAFVDDYSAGERAARVQASAPPIEPADLGDAPCRIGMALGIAGEIGAETLARLRELSEIAVGDEQAFVRHVEPDGHVCIGPPSPALRSQIDRLDFFKLSHGEARALDPASLRCPAIVTHGERGCVLVQGGREIHSADARAPAMAGPAERDAEHPVPLRRYQRRRNCQHLFRHQLDCGALWWPCRLRTRPILQRPASGISR